MSGPPPLLELVGVTKRYGDVVANDGISLAIPSGEIHAVLGENGAGKSTLMKIVYGAVQADAGRVLWQGTPVTIASPADARARGISMVFQHFSLFDSLTVAENVALGLRSRESIDALSSRIAEVGHRYGLDVQPDRHVHHLSVGERQRVEIVRALLTDPRLLILDEPTSVLSPQATTQLFDTLQRLAAEGCAILYITHKLDEIRALCHACTILRNGRVVARVDPHVESARTLARLMIGDEPPVTERAPGQPGEVLLALDGLSVEVPASIGTSLHDVALAVRSGEIVGIAGISGNGQRELFAALSGELDLDAGERVRFMGAPIGAKSPHARRRLGLHAVPEERIGRGAVPPVSLARNVLLSRREVRRGFIDRGRARGFASAVIDRFRVRAPGPAVHAQTLSGGNLQKYIVGREIAQDPRMLVIAQPTWGVDVGAAAQIHAELFALRDRGAGVLVFSEEIEELFLLCDRLYVIANGRLSPSLARRDASVDLVGLWMSGLWHEHPALEAAG